MKKLSDGMNLKDYWMDFMKSLQKQDVMKRATVTQPDSDKPICSGHTKSGTFFQFMLEGDGYVVAKTSQEDPTLIDAVSKMLGSKPFCQYLDGQGCMIMTVHEWAGRKADPEAKMSRLRRNRQAIDLKVPGPINSRLLN